MERRNWLWKKKLSDKVAAAPDVCELASEENVSSKAVQPQQQQPELLMIPEGLQLDETVKFLNEKLAVVQSELAEKDAVAKQHIKVAEEAVTGWEKSESEAATLKKQLEEALHTKMALEDRTLHLDSALKECVRQLRLVREEEEEKIHDIVARKTREWETLRSELENEVAEMKNQLTQSNAHATALSKSLQERKMAILELNDSKVRAEVEARNMSTRLECMEKEYAGLKYDLQVLQRELEIRNEERECNRKMVEAANRQQLENVKKSSKLEAECQRLRMLLKKKLPGPGALAQMRAEAEPCTDGRRKQAQHARQGKSYCPEVGEEYCHLDDKENEYFTDRLRAMEEETKMLKEILAKKNEELHESRLMCAKTASKLSSVEEQLRGQSRMEKHATSVYEEASSAEKFLDSANFELMNDFIEMEKFAADEKERCSVKLESEVKHANEVCDKLRKKLAEAERQLKACRCQNESLQEKVMLGVASNVKFGQEAESKAMLRSSVGRIIHLVESMAQEYSSSTDSSPETESFGPDRGVKRLVAVSKNLLQGKAPVLDFIAELSCALDFVVGLSLNSGSLMGRPDSPKSSERSTATSNECMQEVHQLRNEVAMLEKSLKASGEMLSSVKIQLATVEEERCLLQEQLSATREEKKAVQSELVTVKLVKDKLEARVCAADNELCELRQLTASLKTDLQQEQQRYQDVLQMVQTLQEQKPRHEENVSLKKEQELVAAAEKLAECQRTIHALGKQLESFGLPPSQTHTPARHFSRASELPCFYEPQPITPEYHHRDHHVQRQETYWSSDTNFHANGGFGRQARSEVSNGDSFYHSGPQSMLAEAPEIPLEVRTPARYYRKSKAGSKASYTNAELSKSLNGADMTTSTHCSDKQHGGVLGKLFSRAKGGH